MSSLANRLVLLVGGGVCLAILAAHAALLPEAHWHGDDFICAAYARDGHLRYLWQARIGSWSPRPLSETMFYVFGRVAAARRQPFTVPFLLLLWSLLFASTLITLRRGPAAGARILAGLATSCLFLLGHPVAELFFWPAGAVAYLTTLAAASLALFLLVDNRTAGLAGTFALSASLAACAASSESGALAAIPLSLVLAATLPPRRRAPLLLLPSLLVAGFVFAVLAHHRLVSAEAASRTQPLRQLLASLRPVPRTLLGDLGSIWPAKLCFFLGLRWTGPLHPRARPRASLVGFAAALVLASGASIVAGQFQFASSCCERHDSLRQCWLVLALAALSFASASRFLPGRGAAMLTLAGLRGRAPRIPAMRGDFGRRHEIVAVDRANWRAGRAPGRSMIFRLPPPAALAGGIGIPPGQFTEPALGSWTAHGVMHFFGKDAISIRPPA